MFNLNFFENKKNKAGSLWICDLKIKKKKKTTLTFHDNNQPLDPPVMLSIEDEATVQMHGDFEQIFPVSQPSSCVETTVKYRTKKK